MNTVQIILHVPALSKTTKLGLRQIYPSQTSHKQNYEKGIFDLVKKLTPSRKSNAAFFWGSESLLSCDSGTRCCHEGYLIPLPIIKHRRFTDKILFKFDRRLFTSQLVGSLRWRHIPFNTVLFDPANSGAHCWPQTLLICRYNYPYMIMW